MRQICAVHVILQLVAYELRLYYYEVRGHEMQGGENEGEREGESECEIEGPPSESEGLQGGLRRCDLRALTFTSRPLSLSLSFEMHLH